MYAVINQCVKMNKFDPNLNSKMGHALIQWNVTIFGIPIPLTPHKVSCNTKITSNPLPGKRRQSGGIRAVIFCRTLTSELSYSFEISATECCSGVSRILSILLMLSYTFCYPVPRCLRKTGCQASEGSSTSSSVEFPTLKRGTPRKCWLRKVSDT